MRTPEIWGIKLRHWWPSCQGGKESKVTERPHDSNADAWHVFLAEHLDNRATHPHGLTYVAVQIAEALDKAYDDARKTGQTATEAALQADRLRAKVARLTGERASIGWLFHNPDTGIEFHEQHPVESGMVDDATEIRPATAEHLKSALIDAWEALGEHRNAEGDWMRKCFDAREQASAAEARAQSAEAERDALKAEFDQLWGRFEDEKAALAELREAGRKAVADEPCIEQTRSGLVCNRRSALDALRALIEKENGDDNDAE